MPKCDGVADGYRDQQVAPKGKLVLRDPPVRTRPGPCIKSGGHRGTTAAPCVLSPAFGGRGDGAGDSTGLTSVLNTSFPVVLRKDFVIYTRAYSGTWNIQNDDQGNCSGVVRCADAHPTSHAWYSTRQRTLPMRPPAEVQMRQPASPSNRNPPRSAAT